MSIARRRTRSIERPWVGSSDMNANSRIRTAGHRGLIGSAFVRRLQSRT
jgi:hypothetical protein